MTIVPDSVLVESKSARDYQLEHISLERALEIFNKALLVALWQGTGVTTTQEIARYFEVESSVVRHASKQHRDELFKDGWREVKGQKDLKALCSIGSKVFSLLEATIRISIRTPRAALRLGMILRDSDIAKAVKTSLIDAIEQVISAQSVRTRELELELAHAQVFAAQSQERLMQATNAMVATWRNRPGIWLFIHAVKTGQKPSLTKPGCGWKEWADEVIGRRLMDYLQSQDGDIMVHLVDGMSKLWRQPGGMSWVEIERVANGGETV